MLAFNEAATLMLHLDDLDDEQSEFTFDQLDDRAKDHARNQNRDRNVDHDWWDFIYDDANAIAVMLGIGIRTHTAHLYGGGIRQEPNIWFSGFCSQGDGACFEGSWEPVRHPIDIIANVTDHAPSDQRLHDIALTFALLSERHGPNSDSNGRSWCTITKAGHYCHEYSASINFDTEGPDGSDDWNDLQLMTWEAIQRSRGMDTWQEDVIEALRDFMRWIYSQLEAEYEYLTSDKMIDEYLSELTFDEDGNEI